MMATVRVKFKIGITRIYEDRGRPGGSYSQKLTTDGPFAVITDCYGEKIYIPAEEIEEIKVDAPPSSW